MGKKDPKETAAKVKQIEAEARKAVAEARLAEEKARSYAAQAEADEIAAGRVREEEAKRTAKDEHHLIYRFSGPVSSQSVQTAMAQLTEWHRRFPGEDIEVIFNSPGGSVIDGFELFDFLVDLGQNGHKVITGCTGMAASMGGILVQAGTHRWMSRESWYMIHQAAFGAMGKTFEIEDTVEWIKRIQARILEIFAGRSNLTVRTLKRKWERKDWWIDSDEALKLGLVDEVRASGLAGVDPKAPVVSNFEDNRE
jgi:ATP-dependent Clp endopeptidase proteolytic subunit ClpP